jgi:hypothetical protein
MTRWKASAIHLSLSILVLCLIGAVLVWRWYPPGLFHMANADRLLLIIAGVDVVMGPLLTLVVYKHGKKSLKFDLSVIALMQMTAMAYGLHTVWQSRPVYLVAVVDHFNLVFANEIEEPDRLRGGPYAHLPSLGPETVAVLPPSYPSGIQEMLRSAEAGKAIHLTPAYYTPYSRFAEKLSKVGLPVQRLLERLSVQDRTALAKAIDGHHRQATELVAVPISSSRGHALMLLDASNGKIVGPAAVDISQLFYAPRN